MRPSDHFSCTLESRSSLLLSFWAMQIRGLRGTSIRLIARRSKSCSSGPWPIARRSAGLKGSLSVYTLRQSSETPARGQPRRAHLLIFAPRHPTISGCPYQPFNAGNAMDGGFCLESAPARICGSNDRSIPTSPYQRVGRLEVLSSPSSGIPLLALCGRFSSWCSWSSSARTTVAAGEQGTLRLLLRRRPRKDVLVRPTDHESVTSDSDTWDCKVCACELLRGSVGVKLHCDSLANIPAGYRLLLYSQSQAAGNSDSGE